MATFFTADLHLGHKLVAKLRNFTQLDQDGVVAADTELHDMVLADMWDSTVRDGDEVWLLGDMSINSGAHVTRWLAERPGIKHLVSGNHDKTHTGINPERKSKPKLAEWRPFFASIQDEARMDIAGRQVTLSHFPYWSWGDGPRAGAGDPNFKPRYEAFRPRETPTSILAHGHTHTPERIHDRSIHVGLDAWDLQLVPLATVEAFVSSLP